ncbi:UDP-N-acetylglucosamine 2-epimerase (non-hydrolyzing) [Antarcticibacterium flavum]|uniref:UDP-N-acetylglucosamine 2-epimerase (non-hydrolyzing) n=1 Tax=Antarcticibacterium flavum TaxID=2058175 RepID=A0A5B7X788_9FLAO|nr:MULTISPECIES: UDP-N-acetylglucosamine 2-epimerase (non-hydrolyzing) [Antarcticibacterium]MCM4161398.1 UDP-N-acetylglucosamine 2-epimerase (non-hydrolyzing) [Antarcticibacterium sp. W02-3]QCY70578.1 UDP-N-acetylglucosamine 2-epimerase (non-hydrolyzing) [Antarcticibacterium flavum]
MKVLLTFGTRPEAIKMAPVIRELIRRKINFKVCVTAQHREMLDQVLDFFSIQPDFDLNLMVPDQNLNSLSAQIFKEFAPVLNMEKPDLVIVQGDTTTAFCVAMAAFNAGVKVAHIEAGLRTYNLTSPYPEEGNRQLLSRIANFHFAPTAHAQQNLLKEGVTKEDVYVTGNTSIDALEYAKSILKSGYRNSEINDLEKRVDPGLNLILVTAHRRENFQHGLLELCKSLNYLGNRKDVQILFPVHPNPKVQKIIFENIDSRANIVLLKPLNFPALMWLMEKSKFIISDSGGVQEEAPSFNKIVIVTREVTERIEGLEKGFSILVGTSASRIIEESEQILNGSIPDPSGPNPYGGGNAAARITDVLLRSFQKV